MTKYQVFKEIEADSRKVELRIAMLSDKISKVFRKCRKFPTWEYCEYTHQDTRNKYLISFYAATAKDVDKPQSDYFCLLDDGNGRLGAVKCGSLKYKKDESFNFVNTRAISLYKPHFFDRYRQRYWKGQDICYYELICRYFSRNKRILPIEVDEDVKLKYEENGPLGNYWLLVNDGICPTHQWCEGGLETIGQPDSEFISVMLYDTFLTRSILKPRQLEAIERNGREYLITHDFAYLRSEMLKMSKEFEKLPSEIRPPLLPPQFQK